MIIAEDSRLVMIGDSITDCGRARPVGQGSGLGNGYVNLVDAMLGAACPEKRIRVFNVGSSGNTVRDLAARWQTDVIDLKPDWVSIMIGINDVWRQFDTPLRTEIQVPLDEYSRSLDRLVSETVPVAKGIVLMTPYMIEPSTKDPMRAQMDKYGAAVKKLAARHRTHLVDTQAAFNQVLKHVHPMSMAWDRIHPNTTGHMILARAFLKTAGFEA